MLSSTHEHSLGYFSCHRRSQATMSLQASAKSRRSEIHRNSRRQSSALRGRWLRALRSKKTWAENYP